MFKKISKEALTLGFYIIYITLTVICYTYFPGDAKTPNIGFVLLFLLIPISFGYAIAQVLRHFKNEKSYFKCFLIHGVAWFSIITFLTNFAK